MAEWSQLPAELLALIADRLDSPHTLICFRSVCCSWRTSIPAKTSLIPRTFPFLPNHGGIFDSSWGFYLSKRTIYLISPPRTFPQSSADGWLIKIERVLGKVSLFEPLSKLQFNPLPEDFPKVLNFLNFPILELNNEYVLRFVNYWPLANSPSDVTNLYMEKVVLNYLDANNNDFALLTIHLSGKLVMFKSGENAWNIIPNMQALFDDVILFNGEFYAVDNTGRTVVVGLDGNVSFKAEAVFGGDKKILVESNGELLLVDVYLTVVSNDNDFITAGNYEGILWERTVKFEVFKLAGEEEEWLEVKNLGDTVLFLGENCAFTASVSVLSGCKGNCIFFTDNFMGTTGQSVFSSRNVCVFDLDNGSIVHLSDSPGLEKLFWPPPDWITSTTFGIGRGIGHGRFMHEIMERGNLVEQDQRVQSHLGELAL